MKHPIFATTFATAYLVIYSIMAQFPQAAPCAFFMFLLSPVIVLWMVIAVLKDRRYKASSLNNREFGYQDKPAIGA